MSELVITAVVAMWLVALPTLSAMQAQVYDSGSSCSAGTKVVEGQLMSDQCISVQGANTLRSFKINCLDTTRYQVLAWTSDDCLGTPDNANAAGVKSGTGCASDSPISTIVDCSVQCPDSCTASCGSMQKCFKRQHGALWTCECGNFSVLAEIIIGASAGVAFVLLCCFCFKCKGCPGARCREWVAETLTDGELEDDVDVYEDPQNLHEGQAEDGGLVVEMPQAASTAKLISPGSEDALQGEVGDGYVYEDELNQLVRMGFTNIEANKMLLDQNGGKVDAVASFLRQQARLER